MKNITIDTNVLIDLEEKRNGFKEINSLIELDNKKIVNLYFPAAIANEKYIDRKEIINFEVFNEYLRKIGLKKPKTLALLGYLGFNFFDEMFLFDEDGPEYQLAEKLIKILFPNFQRDYKKFCIENVYDENSDAMHPKFRNIFVDSLILWCHIHYKNDILLTRDENFRKKTSVTKEFKDIKILSPKEFMEMI
jgi:predicted nucleic acid-binding protein